LIMDSLEIMTYIYPSITTCSHAAGYNINVNTRKLGPVYTKTRR
jgi:hypothetical protein